MRLCKDEEKNHHLFECVGELEIIVGGKPKLSTGAQLVHRALGVEDV